MIWWEERGEQRVGRGGLMWQQGLFLGWSMVNYFGQWLLFTYLSIYPSYNQGLHQHSCWVWRWVVIKSFKQFARLPHTRHTVKTYNFEWECCDRASLRDSEGICQTGVSGVQWRNVYDVSTCLTSPMSLMSNSAHQSYICSIKQSLQAICPSETVV